MRDGVDVAGVVEVERALIEAVALWRRAPGGGRWPFAGDGPWHLIRAEWGDYADKDAAPRLLPLSRAELARVQRVSGWLTHITDDEARRVVVVVVTQLARTRRANVRWPDVLRVLGLKRGCGRIERVYYRALAQVVRGIEAAKMSEISRDVDRRGLSMGEIAHATK